MYPNQNCSPQEQPQIFRVYLPPPPLPKGATLIRGDSNTAIPQCPPNSSFARPCAPPFGQAPLPSFPSGCPQFSQALPYSNSCSQPQCYPQNGIPSFPQTYPNCLPCYSGSCCPPCPPGYEQQRRVVAVERLYRGDNKPLITANGISETRYTTRALDLKKDEYPNVTLRFLNYSPGLPNSCEAASCPADFMNMQCYSCKYN